MKKTLQHLKIFGKLKVYRICVMAAILVVGIVSIALSLLMNSKLHEITDVWSPSLSYVQALDTFTSDYRLKQYGHLVATTSTDKDAYEAELSTVDQNISETSALFSAVISTDEELEKYHDIQDKWTTYKEQSEEILELSRAGKTEEAGALMIADVYDTFKDF